MPSQQEWDRLRQQAAADQEERRRRASWNIPSTERPPLYDYKPPKKTGDAGIMDGYLTDQTEYALSVDSDETGHLFDESDAEPPRTSRAGVPSGALPTGETKPAEHERGKAKEAAPKPAFKTAGPKMPSYTDKSTMQDKRAKYVYVRGESKAAPAEASKEGSSSKRATKPEEKSKPQPDARPPKRGIHIVIPDADATGSSSKPSAPTEPRKAKPPAKTSLKHSDNPFDAPEMPPTTAMFQHGISQYVGGLINQRVTRRRDLAPGYRAPHLSTEKQKLEIGTWIDNMVEAEVELILHEIDLQKAEEARRRRNA